LETILLKKTKKQHVIGIPHVAHVQIAVLVSIVQVEEHVVYVGKIDLRAFGR
jgi:hypothetical protein